MAPHPIATERKLEALRHAPGPVVLAALEDPVVVEILAAPAAARYRPQATNG